MQTSKLNFYIYLYQWVHIRYTHTQWVYMCNVCNGFTHTNFWFPVYQVAMAAGYPNTRDFQKNPPAKESLAQWFESQSHTEIYIQIPRMQLGGLLPFGYSNTVHFSDF